MAKEPDNIIFRYLLPVGKESFKPFGCGADGVKLFYWYCQAITP